MVDKISKFYGALSHQEQARLAFSYLIEGNDLELGRISSSVPRRSYICTDPRFRETYDGFLRLACFWTIEHWQAQAMRMAAFGQMLAAMERDQVDSLTDLTEVHERWEKYLLALDRVLEKICLELGIEASIVRKFAEAHPFTPSACDTVSDANDEIRAYTMLSAVLAKG